jgi:O-antigen ligase
MILIPIYFLLKFKSLKKHRFAWIGIIVVLILLQPLIANNQRVGYLYDLLFSKDIDYENQEDTRLIIWKSALEISKKNLLFGVGIGDVRTELADEYNRIGQEKMENERLNAHNQFVEVLLENGIIGLGIFLAIFAVMSYIAISDRNILYGIFISMIFMFFMFETVLYRLAGVTFFSLFSFLLIYLKPAMIENGTVIQKE